jgi:hypothetical protein
MGEVNTIKTTLKFGTTQGSEEKLCPIKDYPDLGGAPELIEITDLDDDTQRFLLGVQSLGVLEFTANYNETLYEAITDNSRTAGYYVLEFGENGKDGIFKWQGQHVVYVAGGGVNAPREMKIVIAASSKIEAVADVTVTDLDLDDLVTAPVTGATPDTTDIDDTQYTGTIAWLEGSTPVTDDFEGETVYKAVVTLSAKAGYKFKGVLANSFTYTGATVTNSADSGIVTITFPATT